MLRKDLIRRRTVRLEEVEDDLEKLLDKLFGRAMLWSGATTLSFSHPLFDWAMSYMF
jgi:hypothetical protein